MTNLEIQEMLGRFPEDCRVLIEDTHSGRIFTVENVGIDEDGDILFTTGVDL